MLGRRPAHDDPARVGQIPRRHTARCRQAHVGKIAHRALQGVIRGHVDQQRLAGHPQPVEQLHGQSRLRLVDRELGQHDDGLLLELRAQSRAQSAPLHLARQAVVVAARLRPEHGAACAPQRVPGLADPRAAGALLAPRLPAGAADEPARLRRVRAAPRTRLLVNHRLPDQARGDRSGEQLVAQLESADRLVLPVDHVTRHRFFFFSSTGGAAGSRRGATARRITT